MKVLHSIRQGSRSIVKDCNQRRIQSSLLRLESVHGATSNRSYSILTTERNALNKKQFIVSDGYSLTTRNYNIVTPASSTTSGKHQDNAVTTDDPVLPTKEVQAEMEKLISIAYCEAKKIAELVEKRRKIDLSSSSGSDTLIDDRTRTSSGKSADSTQLPLDTIDIQNEINAAETLLAMTSHEFFHRALVRHREQESDGTDDVAVSLHCAFLSVINWLCSTLSSLPARPDIANDATNFSSKKVPIIEVAAETLSSKDAILMTYVLQLDERSRDLNFPLSIPQYKKIATMIARYSSGMGGDVSLILLEISTNVSHLYGNSSGEDGTNPIKAEFFSEALKELIKRGLLLDAVMVMHGMQSIHNIAGVDLQTGMELLNILKKKIDDAILISPSGFDDANAMELAMELQRPVMEELNYKVRDLEDYNAMGSLMDRQEVEDDLDDEDEKWDEIMEVNHECDENGNEVIQLESVNEETYVGFQQDMQELNEIVESMNTSTENETINDAAALAARSILNKINAAKALQRIEEDNNVDLPDKDTLGKRENSSGVSARLHVDPSTGEVENVEFLFDPSSQAHTRLSNEDREKFKNEHRELINDLVYSRQDDDSWEIPDIVPQLEEWNGERGLLFSKDYERQLLKEITDDDDDFDDNLAYDDEDEDKQTKI